MKVVELAAAQEGRWPNIAITLSVPVFGEQTAQSCANAWLQQLANWSRIWRVCNRFVERG